MSSGTPCREELVEHLAVAPVTVTQDVFTVDKLSVGV